VANWIRNRPCLAAGILFAPIALAIGIISGGAGHGSYVAARLVLPLACLCLGDYAGALWIVSLLAVLQWPVYGALIDRSLHKAVAAGVILTLHSALIVWLFTRSSPRFR
jgi:hypothetical protein